MLSDKKTKEKMEMDKKRYQKHLNWTRRQIQKEEKLRESDPSLDSFALMLWQAKTNYNTWEMSLDTRFNQEDSITITNHLTRWFPLKTFEDVSPRPHDSLYEEARKGWRLLTACFELKPKTSDPTDPTLWLYDSITRRKMGAHHAIKAESIKIIE